MTNAEIFSWCTILSLFGLAWLATGPGCLCFAVGIMVSQLDVGWISELPSRCDKRPHIRRWWRMV